jgi:serine/threonine protein kinase
MAAFNRDPDLVKLLTDLNVAPAIQDRLFDEGDLDKVTAPHFTVEDLQAMGLSKVRAIAVADKLRNIATVPGSPKQQKKTVSVIAVSSITSEDVPFAFGVTASIYKGTYAGKPVAIKKFKESYIQDYGHWLTREAEVFHIMKHPNIAILWGVCQPSPQEWWLVMEYCEISLRKHLDERGELCHAMILSYARQIVAALEYLHGQGYVHRDLKADNVLLTNQRQDVKLTDFGFTADLKDESGKSLIAQSLVGTGAFMAPEVLTGPGYRLSTTIDIYALGMTLYELRRPTFKGLQPPPGTPDEVEYWREQLARGWRPPLPSSSSEFEKRWNELMEECWKADPDVRLSAKQVASKLSEIETSHPTHSETTQTDMNSQRKTGSSSYGSSLNLGLTTNDIGLQERQQLSINEKALVDQPRGISSTNSDGWKVSGRPATPPLDKLPTITPPFPDKPINFHLGAEVHPSPRDERETRTSSNGSSLDARPVAKSQPSSIGDFLVGSAKSPTSGQSTRAPTSPSKMDVPTSVTMHPTTPAISLSTEDTPPTRTPPESQGSGEQQSNHRSPKYPVRVMAAPPDMREQKKASAAFIPHKSIPTVIPTPTGPGPMGSPPVSYYLPPVGQPSPHILNGHVNHPLALSDLPTPSPALSTRPASSSRSIEEMLRQACGLDQPRTSYCTCGSTSHRHFLSCRMR